MDRKYYSIIFSIMALFFITSCASLCQKPAWYPTDDKVAKYGVVSLTGSEIILYGLGEGTGDQRIAETEAKNQIREAFKQIINKSANQFLKKYPDQTNVINTFKSLAEAFSGEIFNNSKITDTYKCDMTQQYFVMAEYKIDLGKLKMPPALAVYFNMVAKDLLKK